MLITQLLLLLVVKVYLSLSTKKYFLLKEAKVLFLM